MISYAISSPLMKSFFKKAQDYDQCIFKMLRCLLVVLAFVDIAIGIIFFEGVYVAAKGRVTCFDEPDASAIVSIV